MPTQPLESARGQSLHMLTKHLFNICRGLPGVYFQFSPGSHVIAFSSQQLSPWLWDFTFKKHTKIKYGIACD